MSKRLLAAGIVRDLEFDSMDSLEVYLYQLQHKCIDYKCLETFERFDGSVIVRLLCQYNNADLIKLYR